MGARIARGDSADAIPFCFGEDQGRYLFALPATEADRVLREAARAGIPAILLGQTGGDRIAIAGVGEVSIDALKRAHEAWFPGYMSNAELPPTN